MRHRNRIAWILAACAAAIVSAAPGTACPGCDESRPPRDGADGPAATDPHVASSGETTPVAEPPTARCEEDPRVAAILAADDARIAAMTAADPAALAPLLSPDLRYSHSNGAVDTRSTFLELIRAKHTRYVAYRPVAREIRFASPEVALEHGRAEVVLEKNGTRTDATFIFLAVWRLENGSWRFLEWQSARPPP